MEKLITGGWTLSDLNSGKIGDEKNQLKVFSCFHCGGGSTMGYKLAGFDVVGGVEIDPKMMGIYRANHSPKHSFQMPIQEFKNIPYEKLPKELFELDILDGSPPCSSFSMAGKREKKWGRAHAFREGQAVQHLDDLFFDFIDVAKKLQPKVVVAENVKGLISGNARGYVKQIFAKLNEAGYSVQLFLLNASRMGVPQTRERTFFIANKLEKKMKLDFNEEIISVHCAIGSLIPTGKTNITESTELLWRKCAMGRQLSSVHVTGARFNWNRLHKDLPSPTIASTNAKMKLHYYEPRSLGDNELSRLQSFPDDFNFLNEKPGYVLGMSVPPFMAHRVARQIKIQLFPAR